MTLMTLVTLMTYDSYDLSSSLAWGVPGSPLGRAWILSWVEHGKQL